MGASPAPHAEILEVAKEVLKEEGYDLKITEFVDYVQPNLALDSGELDANYFQHKPYLDNFNQERGTKLVSAAAIHYEPYGCLLYTSYRDGGQSPGGALYRGAGEAAAV